MNKPDKIILHCSATEDSGTVSWNAIRRYHMETKGWGAIGYHFGVELIGSPTWSSPGTPEILMGRMPNEEGAHCKGQNDRSIGVCIVGNYDEKPPPVPIWGRTIVLVRWLMVEFDLAPKNVFGHRDFSDKTCPGQCFNLDKFRADLEM